MIYKKLLVAFNINQILHQIVFVLKLILINLLVLFVGLIVLFLSCEIFLRLVGFETRLNPKTYFASVANQERQIDNYKILKNPNLSSEKVDPIIKLKLNSLGMRGEDPPDNLSDYLSFITMGGSTTQCIVLSEGTTWTDYLGKELGKSFKKLWFANAGVDGQSTAGHIEYLQYILKQGLRPKFIIFLVGYNEQSEYRLANRINYGSAEFPQNYTLKIEQKPILNLVDSWIYKVFKNFHEYRHVSSTFMFLSESYRRAMAEKLNLSHSSLENIYSHKFNEDLIQEIPEREVNYKSLDERDDSPSLMSREISNQQPFLEISKNNIRKLIQICRQYNIDPIFLTQPALFGDAIDPVTNKNLGRMILQAGNVSAGQGLTGGEAWKILEAYNDITREVARQEEVKLIDTAQLLSKNSLFYYDYIHFSKPGANKLGEIIHLELCSYLKQTYQTLSSGPCL